MSSRQRHEAGAYSSRVTQLVVSIKADDDGIHAEATGHIAADHELLAEIDTMLHPEATSTAGLIDAIGTLGDDPFQAMTLHEGEHLFHGLAGYLRDADVSVWRDYRLEDFASLREYPLRQILATPDKHIEGIEHDVRFRRTVILKQVEVWFSRSSRATTSPSITVSSGRIVRASATYLNRCVRSVAAAGVDRRLPAAFHHDRTVSVQLQLVGP